jgi:hypothetical protein
MVAAAAEELADALDACCGSVFDVSYLCGERGENKDLVCIGFRGGRHVRSSAGMCLGSVLEGGQVMLK